MTPKKTCAGPDCGKPLSKYNHGKLCGPCEYALGDEIIRRARAQMEPTELRCREPGCPLPVTERSAKTRAPRWQRLCAVHYDEQRVRQSIAVKTEIHARRAAAASMVGASAA